MVVVRPAGESDAVAMLALWREADAEPSRTDDIESVQRLIGHDFGAVIVAELDDRMVGSVIAGWDGWRGSIYRLAVAPAYRRRGIGRRLLEAAESRLSGLGAVRCHAIVVESDDGANGFWRASGWEEQKGRRRFVLG